jgi:outer membrane usher protein
MALAFSVFQQIAPERVVGATAGFSWFFGDRVSASADVQTRQGEGTRFIANATRSMPVDEPGFGWTLRSQLGGQHQDQATLGYRFPVATVEGGVIDSRGAVTETLDARGAVVAMDRSLMLANPIADGFALVDTTVPNVEVFRENNPVGRSDARGKLLLTNLTANISNHLSFDPRDVPPDVDLGSDREVTAPADRAGVLVKFAVVREDAATVVLQFADGTPVPVGSMLSLNDESEPFVVGYDGVAYLKHLRADNQASVALPGDGRCTVRFAYAAQPGHATQIGPLVCEIMTARAP